MQDKTGWINRDTDSGFISGIEDIATGAIESGVKIIQATGDN